jgi:hypothetical protein
MTNARSDQGSLAAAQRLCLLLVTTSVSDESRDVVSSASRRESEQTVNRASEGEAAAHRVSRCEPAAQTTNHRRGL